MAAGHVLAIDQGTTGSTALVIDPAGDVVGRGYAELPQHFPRPGWVEHDPLDLFDTAVSAGRAALSAAGRRGEDIAAIGITNQRETTVLWDRKTGTPVANAVVWQDRRTAEVCAQLRSRGLEEVVRSRTGLVIDAYFSGPKIAWLLDHTPGLRARAEAGEIAFGTVDSWLLHRFTGGRVHVTDYTNASRTMLFDIHRMEWDRQLLEEMRVPESVLPEVRSSARIHGVADREIFGAEIPIAALVGDQQAALFAQACVSAGQTKTTYGTGSFVLMHCGESPCAHQRRTLSTVAAGLEGSPAQYALEGSIFVTGSALQWLRDEMGIISSAAESEALAQSVPDTGDVWFVPALAGLGAPYWDPYARGMIIGLTRGTSRAQLVRSVLESIAFSNRDVLEAMQEDSGVAVGELRADGGGAANRFLLQFQADILGIPVDVAEKQESTAAGSGLLAGLAVGVWTGLEQVEAMRASAARYEPTMSVDERDARYARWLQAVERARSWAQPDG